MKTLFLTSNTSWYLYNFRRSTIAALKANGFNVVCLSPQDKFSSKLVCELGVEHIALPMDGKGTGIKTELISLLFIFKTFLKYKPFFVFNFTIKLNLYGGIVCSVLRIPFSNNISGLGTAFIHDSFLFRRVRQLYGLVNRGAQRLFFQNEEDLGVFKDSGLMGKTPYTLLPGSGVDLNRFAYCELPKEGVFTFILIARLLGDKGVREYADACRLLQQKGLSARCLLLGPLGVSNQTAIDESEVKQWQDENLLEYLGETSDVRPFLKQAHVLVLPSYREGMPRTVLEAAAVGRPAIVTDVPGCRQSIEVGKTGWLCKVRDATSLADTMQRVMEIDREELQDYGYRARQRMSDFFSEKVVVEAYLNCLKFR